MRSLQSISAYGSGERVVTMAPNGGRAFRWGTEDVLTPESYLATWENDDALVAGIFADGSMYNEVLAGPPATLVDNQWWFEDDGGSPVLKIRFGGGTVTLAGGGGGGGTITEVVADTGLIGGGSSGSVSLEVDFSAVAAVGHDHDPTYLRLDGGNAMSGALRTVDGAAATPALGPDSDLDTGIFFDVNTVGIAVGGSQYLGVTPTGLQVSNTWIIPFTAPAAGQVLGAPGGTAAWTNLAHGDLSGVGPNDHHPRSHPITSVADHTGAGDSVLYVNDSGEVVELGLGAAGTVLTSQGAGAAPTWTAASQPVEAALPAVGYSFQGATDTGFTSDGSFLYLVLDNVTLLRLGPGGARFNDAFTLPNVDGLAGQALITDGAGVVGWSSVSHDDLADVTEDQHHPRTHSMDSETDHLASPYRVFWSDGSGHVQELALGADGQVLQSNGPAVAPSFEDQVGGGGDLDVDQAGGYYGRHMLLAAGGV